MAYCSTSFNCVYPDSCPPEPTTTTDHTVTWLPDPCLPYDGSEVPDCSEYLDPITMWRPSYVQHSYSNENDFMFINSDASQISCSDCSRYWECGPEGETCLMECAMCQREIGEVEMCEDRWALTFDVSYQFPIGPVCDWPANVECSRCPNLPCAPIND